MSVGSPGPQFPLLGPVGAAPLEVGQPRPRVRQEVDGGDLEVRLLSLKHQTGGIILLGQLLYLEQNQISRGN